MVRVRQKINAFTILESMVAMVIVMIVFGLSSIVIINVSSSGITNENKEAHALVKLTRNEAIKQNLFIDESIKEGNITIEKSIIDYYQSDELKVLLIEAYSGEKKVFEIKELIKINIK